MKNLLDPQCKNCNKSECSYGSDYSIIIVKFEGANACTITHNIASKNTIYDYINKYFSSYTNKYYITLELIHYIFAVPRRFDKKNGFTIICKRTKSIDKKMIKEHFYKWLNNKITHGRFNEIKLYDFTKRSIDDLLCDANINHFKNKRKYIGIVIKIESYKQQFYKALYMED